MSSNRPPSRSRSRSSSRRSSSRSGSRRSSRSTLGSYSDNNQMPAGPPTLTRSSGAGFGGLRTSSSLSNNNRPPTPTPLIRQERSGFVPIVMRPLNEVSTQMLEPLPPNNEELAPLGVISRPTRLSRVRNVFRGSTAIPVATVIPPANSRLVRPRVRDNVLYREYQHARACPGGLPTCTKRGIMPLANVTIQNRHGTLRGAIANAEQNRATLGVQNPLYTERLSQITRSIDADREGNHLAAQHDGRHYRGTNGSRRANRNWFRTTRPGVEVAEAVPITPVTAARPGLRQRVLGSLRNWFRRTNRTRRARSSSR